MVASTAAETPPVRSEAQREAARRNGRKSSGPRTAEGKSISRRNALRHGHRAEHPELLPAELQERVEAELRAFERAFLPRDEFEGTLVRQAATASARIARLAQADLERAEERARHAVERWDLEHSAEVDRQVEALALNPDRALSRLLGSAEGCAGLADRWQTLVDAIEEQGGWTDPQRRLALALLGLRVEPGPRDETESAELFRLEREGTPEARAALLNRLDAKLDELDARIADLWDRVDAPDRAGAPSRALFDPSPEGRLLARYLAEAERMQRRAIDLLHRHRRGAPNEPERVARSPRRRGAEPDVAGFRHGDRATSREGLPHRAEDAESTVGKPVARGSLADLPSSLLGPFAALREILPSLPLPFPLPNEPEPDVLPVAIARDPAERRRRPDPAKRLRQARR